jgi:hypothetical protein
MPHNGRQLNEDALEPPSDSTQIQPHDAVTRRKRQTVATQSLSRNHPSAGHLCQLAACRTSGEEGTEALAAQSHVAHVQGAESAQSWERDQYDPSGVPFAREPTTREFNSCSGLRKPGTWDQEQYGEIRTAARANPTYEGS